MKKISAIVLGLTIVLSMLAIISVSATIETTDFNHYAWSTEAPLTVDENGDFSSFDAGWKLSEYKTTPEKDFVAEMDVYAIDGVVKDSINIRLRDADKFNTGAFDATTGYGVFVEATSSGNMYIYINKWVDSAWKGYLPLQGSTATNLTDSNIVQAAGADYTITFRISVQGDIVKAQAFLKGTDKRTAAATFDLSAPASGENAENNATIPAGGNIALATMRGKVGKLFGNFKCYNNGDFNGYGSDGSIGLANDNGTFISDGTSWKMNEYKTEPEADFTASVDCHTADGYLKDSINFRVKNSANFSSDGYDATIGLGAFVEANNDGTMYLYINKWSGGWKGYQPRVDIAETNLTDTELLAGVGTEYTVNLEVTVEGNRATVQALLKGTDKKTAKVTFDLAAPASGETEEDYTYVMPNGTVALTTMRWWAKGTVFSNFNIKNKSELGSGEGETSREDITAVFIDDIKDGTKLDDNWCGGLSSPKYYASTVAGRKAARLIEAGDNGCSYFRNQTAYEDNRAFKVSYYIDGWVSLDSIDDLLSYQFKDAFNIKISKTGFQVTGDCLTVTDCSYDYAETFGSDYSPYARWIDMEVIFAGDRIILNFDGEQFVYTVSGSFSGDTETADKVEVYNCSNRLGKVSFSDIKYQNTDILVNAISAIDGIGEVSATKASAELINTAYNSYEILNSKEKGNVVNSGKLTEAVNSYKELSGGADVNLSGSTDIIDLVALKKVTAGVRNKNFMCDLDDNGDVAGQDLVVLRKLLLTEKKIVGLGFSIDKIYKITNTYTGKALDAAEFGYVDGAVVRNKDYDGDLNQLWALETDGSGKTIIYNLTTGFVLTVKEGSESDGAEIVVDELLGSDAQKWLIDTTGDVTTIRSALSEKPIGIENDNTDDSAQVKINVGNSTQTWKLEEVQLNSDKVPYLLKLSGAVEHSSTPEVVRYGDKYYSYNMSPGIGIKVSDDMKSWKYIDQVTAYPQVTLPFSWMLDKVDIDATTGIWAPGVYKIGDLYYMYYCISSSGSQKSAIGVGVNITLDSSSPDFKWVDLGLVISSDENDRYNCIDPNIIIDDEGKPWLIFGSWHDGIFARRIDEKTGKLSNEDTYFYQLASRLSQDEAIEAPYMIKHGEYYYLFAAFGTGNNYHCEVGRSTSVTGPFLDRDGNKMLEGGGTKVTYGNEYFGNPGHASIFIDEDGQHYMVSESFNNNNVIMMISTLEFDDEGWPITALTPGIAK